MARVTIYHNPRCSKSRQTLALLREQGIEPEIVEYLETPPTRKRLGEILDALGKEPLEVMRTGEKRFKELGLSKKDDRPRKEWIRILANDPILLEWPIVTRGKKAALGRPPESVLEIL
jgi:arsenate reductase